MDGPSNELKVPLILRPLLESFAREVLQNKPNDLIEFGRIYFEVFEEHRIEHKQSEAVVLQDQARYEQFRNDLTKKIKQNLRKKCRMKESSKENSDPCLMNDDENKAARKIQAVFRGHMVRAHPEKFGSGNGEFNKNGSTGAKNKRHSIGGANWTTSEQKAATKIQAEVRGYLARKHYEQQKEEFNKAATKIQAHIRGFLTRKKFEEEGVVLSPRPRSAAD